MCVLCVPCLRNLAGRVGLPVSIEVVAEPLGQRHEHDLNGQTDGGGAKLGRLAAGFTRGRVPLVQQVVAVEGAQESRRTEQSSRTMVDQRKCC